MTLSAARYHGMHMRRFTRLTDAFSKKVENHAQQLRFIRCTTVEQNRARRISFQTSLPA
jgi:hypothetical protein